MKKVYHKLKEYCQLRGYDFQVVDMRWGVRDEATADHMTSELCMKELKACQQLSTGPNFIVSIMHIVMNDCNFMNDSNFEIREIRSFHVISIIRGTYQYSGLLREGQDRLARSLKRRGISKSYEIGGFLLTFKVHNDVIRAP